MTVEQQVRSELRRIAKRAAKWAGVSVAAAGVSLFMGFWVVKDQPLFAAGNTGGGSSFSGDLAGSSLTDSSDNLIGVDPDNDETDELVFRLCSSNGCIASTTAGGLYLDPDGDGVGEIIILQSGKISGDLTLNSGSFTVDSAGEGLGFGGATRFGLTSTTALFMDADGDGTNFWDYDGTTADYDYSDDGVDDLQVFESGTDGVEFDSPGKITIDAASGIDFDPDGDDTAEASLDTSGNLTVASKITSGLTTFDLFVGAAQMVRMYSSLWEFTEKYAARATSTTIADSGDANPATLTLDPTLSNVEVTCNDADTCDITMSEVSALDMQELCIQNIGTNVVDMADTAGVSELNGAFAMGQYDVICMVYNSAAGTWIEKFRSDN